MVLSSFYHNTGTKPMIGHRPGVPGRNHQWHQARPRTGCRWVGKRRSRPRLVPGPSHSSLGISVSPSLYTSPALCEAVARARGLRAGRRRYMQVANSARMQLPAVTSRQLIVPQLPEGDAESDQGTRSPALALLDQCAAPGPTVPRSGQVQGALSGRRSGMGWRI